MDSEKVKVIKEYLRCMRGEKACWDCGLNEIAENQDTCCINLVADMALDLINELESENERLSKSFENAINEIDKLKECYKIKAYDKLRAENKQLKDRIAELEEALLDMVVQFCQMRTDGELCHTFMSAEEQAFDILEIQYGEKVSDVYKRFFKRWGREYEE